MSGIQISELLPRVSKQMDKLAIIRSLHTEEADHTPAIHYAATGHRPNAAMHHRDEPFVEDHPRASQSALNND